MTAQHQTRFTLAEVRAALDKYIASVTGSGHGCFTFIQASQAVSQALNGTYDPYDHATESQARRDLDLRARAGALVKVSRNQPGPSGSRNHRQAFFWLPDAYAREQEQHEDRQQRKDAHRDRLGRIHDSLVALDITPSSGRGYPPVISAASWEKLLGMAPGGE